MSDGVIINTKIIAGGRISPGGIEVPVVKNTVRRQVVVRSTVAATGPMGIGLPEGGTDGQRLAKVGSGDFLAEWVTPTASDVGLGNVDNTSDADKPVSTAQQAALDLKLDDSQLDTDGTLAANSDSKIASQKAVKTYIVAGLATKQPLDADLTSIAALDSSTSGAIASDGAGWIKKTYAQFKTALSLVKGDVGLGNVDNTSDVNKPVSTAQQTAIDAKVADAINDGVTTIAPSENAVFDALALKIPTSYLDTDGTLAANSDVKIATQKATKTYADLKLAKASNLSDLANASTARTNLGVAIGTDVEAHDADLTTIAGLMPTNDDIIQRKAGAWTNRTMAQLIADLAAVGTTFQPLDSDLTTIAGLTATTDNIIQSKAGAWSSRTMAQLIADLAAVGTTFQPLDSDLTTIAGLTATTDNFMVATASAWASRTPSQARSQMGLGSIALLSTITEANITLADNTTNDVSTSAHGFVPKGTNTGKFLKDNGTWDAIPGGGDALTSSSLAQFAATTSAQLRGVLSDETGTGAAVFATSPALTTPTGIVKGDVGLGNVDNTSDATKNAASVTLTNKTLDSTSPTAFFYPGFIQAYVARTAPTGWLNCDGSAVSRTTYAALFAAIAPTLGTFTVTIATPAVVTKTAHGLSTGDAVYLTTTGALPTGLTANTLYYIVRVDANSFNLSTTRANAYAATKIATTGSQSGTHTVWDCPYGLGDGSTTFTLPDLRGRSPAGVDTTGGTAASRLTLAQTQGVYGNLGATGGEQGHQLTIAELAAHTHTLVSAANVSAGSGLTPYVLNAGAGQTTGSTGSDTAHNTVQPTQLVNYIIKT